MNMNKARYRQYLQSAAWNVTRRRRLAVSGFRCEFCPEVGSYKYEPLYGERCDATEGLEVHHKQYERVSCDENGERKTASILYDERDHEMEVLCRFHHLVRHACRAPDCPTCGDTTQVDEEDAVDAVENAIRDRGGRIALVQLDDIEDVSHCSYCER